MKIGTPNRKTQLVDDSFSSDSDPQYYYNIRNFYLHHFLNHQTKVNINDLHSGIIGFCGKLYPYVYKVINPHEVKEERVFAYDSESYFRKIHKFRKNRKNEENKIKSLLDLYLSQNFHNLLSLFEQYKVPIFQVETGHHYKLRITINVCLKDFQFASVMEPYKCYQELLMYFGSTLADTQERIPDVSDKDLAAAKGFGGKYAFRKEPLKKE